MKKNIYLVMAIIGFVVPYSFFLQLPGDNGFDIPAFIQPLFANNFMKGLAVDLTISLLVFSFFIFSEVHELGMRNPWLFVLAALLVGLSFALPLFLYFRERQLENINKAAGLDAKRLDHR